MKRALLIGIDTYDQYSQLSGCANDVRALVPLLARNEDGSPNFDCQSRTSDSLRVERRVLIESVDALLAPGADVALLFFAGHGVPRSSDVALVTQDGSIGDPGIALADVLGRVNSSPVREVILVLDCCYSGSAGGSPQRGGNVAVLRPGVSLLTASRGDQPSEETTAGRGVFSTFLCGALDGGAADVLGLVSIAGVYAYLSESFGPWQQRPIFKTHMEKPHVLRTCSPAVPIPELRTLPALFTTPDFVFPLDSSYEPDADPRHPDHEATFAILQRCRAAKLVEPIGTPHMYYAAMEGRACRLTPLGKHYWNRAQAGRL